MSAVETAATPEGMRPGEQRRARWEQAAWTFLLVAALLSRFAALDERVMSHDESLHAYYSHLVSKGAPYLQDPALHGPLLYHLNGAVFWLLGANDFTARITPAAAGAGLILLIFLFRPYLGRVGAPAAALLVTISPTLLFYSRYLRNDAYIALLALVWLYVLVRCLEDRRRVWLVPLTVAMALSFAAKETSFIFAAIVAMFLVGRAVLRLLARTPAVRWSGEGDLVAFMLVLLLPFAAPLAHFALGWQPTDVTSSVGLGRSLAVVAGGFCCSALVAVAWFGWLGRRLADRAPRLCSFADAAKLMLLFWSLELLLFTSLLRNVRSGFASGVVGSLGYWLLQHEVARGSQPWFYYLMLGALYELLPLLLAAAAAVALLRHLVDRRGATEAGRAAPADRLPPASRTVLVFCLWWWIASLLAYSIAGEKMPWLMTHLVLPACLLGGWWVGRLVEDVACSGIARRHAVVLLALAPALALCLLRLSIEEPFSGRSLQAVAASGRWLSGLLGAVLIVAVMAGVSRRVDPRLAVRLGGLGLVVLLAAVTVRTAAMASFTSQDLPVEPLAYAEGTPDVRSVLEQMELLEQRADLRGGLKVAFGDGTAWPMSWYLRQRRAVRFYGGTPDEALEEAHVVLVGDELADAAWPYLARDFVGRQYRLIWWPLEDYRQASLGDLWRSLSNAESRRKLWRRVWLRGSGLDSLALEHWPLVKRFGFWVRRDVLEAAWDLESPAAGPASRGEGALWRLGTAHPRDCLDGTFEGLRLRQPTGLAVSADGDLFVADTGNHRILVFDADEKFRSAFGSRCDLAVGTRSGCFDPDGDGPLEPGDGQFKEPWAVVAGDREVVVADTWNGRIQVLDRAGRFLRKWGRLAMTAAARGSHDFFGPRAVAFDSAGGLLVTDTGHNRVLLFDIDGRLRRSTAAEEGYKEPVGVAVGRDGAVYVGDTWRRRIRRLDARLRESASWHVPGWDSTGPLDKPYLTLGDDGLVYATDPSGSRILVFAPDGRIERALLLDKGRLPAPVQPTGIAFDAVRGRLWVSDTANHRVCALTLGADGGNDGE